VRAAPAVDVGRTIDEGGSGVYQGWLVFLTALTIIFDGIDNQLLGIAIPAMMQEWSVPRSAFAPVVAVSSLGMMVGGAVAGLAGDRFGRRVALLASMALFGAATLAIWAVDSTGTLTLLRLAAGFGLGGALPNAAALAAEYVPRRQRPFAVTVTIVCVPVGGTLAGLLAVPALPAVGWRGLFAIGGIVPLVAAVTFARLLPESPRYLARYPRRWPELVRVLRHMGHRVDEDAPFVDMSEPAVTRAPLTMLFERRFRRDTFALWTAFFSCLLAVYLAFAWLPSMLAGAGLGATVASTSLTAFNLGGVVGALAGGMVMTRIGSRPTMLAMAGAAVAGAAILSVMPIAPTAPVVPILAMLTITGGLINAVQVAMYALAAHVYPTAIRATGVGTAVAVGRTGPILAGYAGPWALEHGGGASFFQLMAASVLVSLVALALVRRHVPRPIRTPR
jgi:AAHS family 4-hydroxybenzoate transporter-like MFS transporter